MTAAADKRHEQLKQDAYDAFTYHQIRYSEETHGRWLLQRRTPRTAAKAGQKDGDWTSIFSAEIVALWGGRIYVGGDIQGVQFSYGPSKDGPRSLIRWMGECTDIGYYVAQKAAIGAGDGGRSTEVFDGSVAAGELKALCDEERKQLSEHEPYFRQHKLHWGRAQALEEIIEGGCFAEHELTVALSENLDSDFLCDVGRIGMVLDAKVYYAHAAMARLCEIWSVQAEKEAK